ncbi:MAG: hypothetical protein V5A64_01465 [Candidatus Thermoplasmatota archaeon]
MKANKKTRNETDQGVSGVAATLMVIPAFIGLISTMYIFSDTLTGGLSDAQNVMDDSKKKIVNSTVIYSPQIKISSWEDDFEEEKLQWEKYSTGSNSKSQIGYIKQYWTKGKSLQIKTGKGEESGVIKHFAWKPYKKVEIEISFTIDSNEKYKTFNISQQKPNINKASILLNVSDKKIFLYNSTGEYQLIEENIPLHANKHCWHHMKLVINFDKAKYQSFTLGGIKHNLSMYNLNYSTPNMQSNSFKVKFSNFVSPEENKAFSCVDDFAIHFSSRNK